MAADPKDTKRGKGAPRAGRVVPLAKPEALGRNNEAERSLLGAMLLSYEAYEACIDVLVPSDFYEPKHQTVFEALGACARAEDGTVDVVMLDEELKRSGQLASAGGSLYVHEMIDSCPNWQQYREYLAIVLECSLRRVVEGIGAQLMQAQLTTGEAQVALEGVQARRELVQHSAGMGPRLAGVLASEIVPEPIAWLWRRRLARGKLTIIDGNGGLGKGHMTIDIAARLSAGRAFPGDMGITQEPQAVVLVSPEDDEKDTLRPRLEAAGADLTKIRIINVIKERDATTGKETERAVTFPRDIPIVESAITGMHAGLLIIDPIMGCLDAGVKTGVDSEVRSALMPLKHLATRTGISVVMIRHLNKGTGSALMRGGGSVAFGALARIVLLVAEHPDNDAKRVLLPVKHNLSKEAEGLAFSLASNDPDGIAWVSWDQEPVPYNADDVLNSDSGKESGEAREVIEAMRGLVNLPAKISDIMAAMGKDPHDDKDYARISRRIQRMAKAGRITSPVYGQYGLTSGSNRDQGNSLQLNP